MSDSLRCRLMVLEAAREGDRPLPLVVADDASDAELLALARQSGMPVYRMADAVELFV